MVYRQQLESSQRQAEGSQGKLEVSLREGEELKEQVVKFEGVAKDKEMRCLEMERQHARQVSAH